MKNWPLPNLDGGKVRIKQDLNRKNWYSPKHHEIYDNIPIGVNLPFGWSNPWPDLPNPDEDENILNLQLLNLRNSKNYCTNNTLGYYMSWHLVGVSFQNEYGRLPYDGNELKFYNGGLPEENRFGIHICCKTIENYIKKFSTENLAKDQIPLYLEYCTYLTLIYVIAHEWGHYRSEVLSFQLTNLVKSITGDNNSQLSPSYLSYYIFKKQYPYSNFEEVFSEWASLKLGIFNYHMKKPSFARSMSNWPLIEATVKFMLSQAISRPNRIRPYSDIRFWINFDEITNNEVMQRISENKKSLNRSVNENVNIERIKSFHKGKIIDLLMHNQLQFATAHNFNGLIESAPIAYPIEPDSIYYHIGDDECLQTYTASNSEHFLKLGNPNYKNIGDKRESKIIKIINKMKIKNSSYAPLPIKIFPEILGLDPVYFHT